MIAHFEDNFADGLNASLLFNLMWESIYVIVKIPVKQVPLKIG